MRVRKRIYIVVKTYPTISKEYAELVCTAGILEDGSWIRLYPISFRRLDIDQKYPKYTWVEVDVEENPKDNRHESYRPFVDTLQVLPNQSMKVDWDERRKIIFNNKKVYTNLTELIDKAKTEKVSLAVFKPKEIVDFIVEETEREWDTKTLKSLYSKGQQLNIFLSPDDVENEFKVVKKVPYKFSYRFIDDTGRESTLMIEDWEIGMLYFNCLERANGNEEIAIESVRKKYFDEFVQKDLHLFMGTTLKFHNVAPNPFIIIGIFYPPRQKESRQMSLLDID